MCGSVVVLGDGIDGVCLYVPVGLTTLFEPGDVIYVVVILFCVFICTRLFDLARPHGTHSIEQCSLNLVT